MTDQIQNTIAEISAIEDTGIQLKLKDKNKKSLGSFFKNKKDGEETVAFKQFVAMEIKSGSVIEISFKEVPYKDGMIKNIIGFREAAGRPVEKSVESTVSKPTQSTERNGNDAFGRRLAIHGMVNGMLASGVKPAEITTAMIIEIDLLETRINNFLDNIPDIPF